ncbi:DUF1351 domain-containing protein [Collinsella sp. AF38-3AC]|uniref:DUF1351 domain-containing protein n=1 Tax=Collinsella sp. AF38-3AC TaxID=2292015 RepID=UPI000E53D76F|nr:DUF1351 domain-containing protein [Collinsella sp. AF38-3AC]RHL22342.1 DUF1351 domain-containing protein [Collinsella sp. AF38-3AC]
MADETTTVMPDEGNAIEKRAGVEEIKALLDSVTIDGDLKGQLDALAKAVDEAIEDYRDPKPIGSGERLKEMRRWRANVRKVKEPIEERRKASKKRYTDLIKQFDSTIGRITAPIDELDKRYKALIDEYEAQCRENVRAELEAHYAELAPNLVPVLPASAVIEDAWLKPSVGTEKAKRVLEGVVASLARQYESVMDMEYADESERGWAVKWWADNRPDDSGEVARAVRRHREEMERVAELNAGYRASRAPRPAPEPAPEAPRVAPEPEPAAMAPEVARPVPQEAPAAAYRVIIDCPDVETLRAVRAVMVSAGFHGRVERA